MPTIEVLARVGEALYGPRWQSELARALGVSDRTMRRWVAGDEPPDGVLGDLAALMKERTKALAALIARIQEEEE